MRSSNRKMWRRYFLRPHQTMNSSWQRSWPCSFRFTCGGNASERTMQRLAGHSPQHIKSVTSARREEDLLNSRRSLGWRPWPAGRCRGEAETWPSPPRCGGHSAPAPGTDCTPLSDLWAAARICSSSEWASVSRRPDPSCPQAPFVYSEEKQQRFFFFLTQKVSRGKSATHLCLVFSFWCSQ